jgi:osmoprotectant transport system ATP-binding protein
MLMDEPFAAIDAITRLRLQDELLDIQRKLHKTILFVTHDVEEALRLADKIAVLRAGRLVQYGTPLEIITHPQDEFVAALVGSGDLLRKLSLLNVRTLLNARSGQGAADHPVEKDARFVRLDDDLRTALSRLLESETGVLPVVDSEGHPAGKITFNDLRAVLTNDNSSPQGQAA